ncbi:MAG: geranylgeranylglyceryl/heptaprenylglyceryl phosphate synthase [Marinilabiliales bacterium]|nr:MAG: geranylgeranylglyceryl/heptaprenylglyceryl phosphate synthase [Marinilabiliales bacterium]
MHLYQKILSEQKRNEKSIAIVIDPDKTDRRKLMHEVKRISHSNIRYIFVGGSLLSDDFSVSIINALKDHTDIPVISFPGNAMQINTAADAILYLSLLSGRNPEYLIGQHVVSAPKLYASSIEVISTGYLLIDGGVMSSTAYVSNTTPIPSNKPYIAACTAIAAEFLGMKMLYLEAGSGALFPVSQKMIQKVREVTSIPIITGGGIKTPEDIRNAASAGADIMVLGSVLEENFSSLPYLAGALEEASLRV